MFDYEKIKKQLLDVEEFSTGWWVTAFQLEISVWRDEGYFQVFSARIGGHHGKPNTNFSVAINSWIAANQHEPIYKEFMENLGHIDNTEAK